MSTPVPASAPATPEAVVGQVRLVPDGHRDFDTSLEHATRFHRLSRACLERLVEQGLPHSSDATGLLFDRYDLRNVALLLGVRSPQRATYEAMAAALRAGGAGAAVRRTVVVRAYCPDREHCAGCAFVLDPVVTSAPEVVAVRRPGASRFEVDVLLAAAAATPPPTPEQRRLLDEAAGLRFHLLPPGLTADLGFLRETGLADCTLAVRHLVARAGELGVPARPATGLCLSRPFANRHHWLELRDVEGRWWPADPFFLRTLAGWGLLADGDWPAHRRPVGAYWRVDLDLDVPMLRHRGAGGAAGGSPPERLGPAYFLVQ
ncbi:hypothetical protein [Micromonospora sp. HUAS LYJ1]|uniref:transglutaminase domain-containing protein n=1 Tax=Micromonospora sp. HUAS LYJ1 TaxID=3061626 RepID=UPI002672D7BD|nr:hypothetical protein [Micromonospora sp. HUAS LYJ1]WKU07209.1 hypothetical protein Q2K16_09265 [Micromonospora sp. HUAS LYJ1]